MVAGLCLAPRPGARSRPRSGAWPLDTLGPVCEVTTEAGRLIEVAREFSPRIERHGDLVVTLDVGGLGRVLGPSRAIGAALVQATAARGLHVHVAIAGTRTAALLMALARPGLTVVDPGQEAARLAPLPLSLLEVFGQTLADPAALPLDTLRRWGMKTLGDLAGLPAGALAERLGQSGVHWQRLARGADTRPLVPSVPEERFEASLDLEWPIEGLEPLSFVLGRLFDPLSEQLARRDRGAAVLHVRLQLVTRDEHVRRLELPAPIRDPRVLRTLVLLDLESHPPAAGVDRLTIAIDPTPGRVWQYSLLARAVPSPETLSTLMARITALVGEGRAGSPALVDSHRPGAFAMEAFQPDRHAGPGPPRHAGSEAANPGVWPRTTVRRFRHPLSARVLVEHGRPVRVATDAPGLAVGQVAMSAGPWRTSGAWWETAPSAPGLLARGDRRLLAPASGASASLGTGEGSWNRDEWDVALADGTVYRLFHDRDRDRWFLDGVMD